MASNCDQVFVNEELKYVREKLTELVEGTELIACHLALVQVKVKYVIFYITYTIFENCVLVMNPVNKYVTLEFSITFRVMCQSNYKKTI